MTWKPVPMKPVDSSSKDSASTANNLDKVSDNNASTYWVTDTPENEFVTFDFGGRRTLQHAWSRPSSATSTSATSTATGSRSARTATDWVTIKEGVNPDMAGSSLKYKLDQPVSARYLRYTMKDTSCDQIRAADEVRDGVRPQRPPGGAAVL